MRYRIVSYRIVSCRIVSYHSYPKKEKQKKLLVLQICRVYARAPFVFVIVLSFSNVFVIVLSFSNVFGVLRFIQRVKSKGRQYMAIYGPKSVWRKL